MRMRKKRKKAGPSAVTEASGLDSTRTSPDQRTTATPIQRSTEGCLVKQLPILLVGGAEPPPRRDELWVLAILAVVLLGALALTGDVESAVLAVTALAGLAR